MGLFDNTIDSQSILRAIQQAGGLGTGALNPASPLARFVAPGESAARRAIASPTPPVGAQGFDASAPAIPDVPPPPAIQGPGNEVPVPVPNIMEGAPEAPAIPSGTEGLPIPTPTLPNAAAAGAPPAVGFGDEASLASTGPSAGRPGRAGREDDTSVGAALTGNTPVPTPLPRPDPRTLMMAAGGGGGGGDLGAPEGPTSVGGAPLAAPGAPGSVGGPPLGGPAPAAASPQDNAGLAKALQGVRAPLPPVVQKISTPNAPRPTGTIHGGDLLALLQSLNAASPETAGRRVPMPLLGGR